MKKISAMFAVIAALLFSVFALTPSAMADPTPYSASISASANADGTATVTVTLDEATYNAGYQYVGAQVNDANISNVTLAAEKTYGWWQVSSARTATFKLSTLNCTDTTIEVLAAKDTQGGSAREVGETTVSFPATCKVVESAVVSKGAASNEVAKTGVSVMPYAVAVVLLAVAGGALFVMRKNAR